MDLVVVVSDMTFVIDIDNVVNDFSHVLLPNLNQIYGTSYKYEDINSWDWYVRTFDNPWLPLDTPIFWNHVEINPYAVYVIERLVNNGDNVYLCTASHFNSTLSYKINKTLSFFNPTKINGNNIIISQNKGVISATDDTTVRIDDNPNNLFDEDINILFDQPWNKDVNKWQRARNWREIEEIINKLY